MREPVAGLLGGVAALSSFRSFLFTDLPRLHVLASSFLMAVFAQLGSC